MANFMFILRPTEKKYRVVCPDCAKRGEVLSSCKCCHGVGVISKRFPQYYLQDKPIEITRIDRDPETGILRYWEDSSDFFYETLYPELNKYVPNVIHGIHLCHDTWQSAHVECERINKYLKNAAKEQIKESNSINIGRFDF